MTRALLIRIAPLLLLGALSAPALSETRYVSDELEITLRAGNSTQHKITRMLKSGTSVEILDEDGGWAHVRLDGGREGWVLTRFLSPEPSARDRLAVAEKQLAQLRNGDDVLRRDLANLQTENRNLQADNARVSAENAKLTRDLRELRAATKDTVAVVRSNGLLKAKLAQTEQRIETLETENRTLRDATARTWFLYGAGVIFGGILLGLILPRIPLPRRKRRGMWDTL